MTVVAGNLCILPQDRVFDMYNTLLRFQADVFDMRLLQTVAVRFRYNGLREIVQTHLAASAKDCNRKVSIVNPSCDKKLVLRGQVC